LHLHKHQHQIKAPTQNMLRQLPITQRKVLTKNQLLQKPLTHNRKEYVKDGQLATPTGHEATPINSDQYQSPRDSSDKKRKKQ
jgi:hypothetical protein